MVPVVAKMLEKFVAQWLSSYYENHQTISPNQCAYRQGTSEQLLLVAIAMDTIAIALDNKSCACVAF